MGLLWGIRSVVGGYGVPVGVMGCGVGVRGSYRGMGEGGLSEVVGCGNGRGSRNCARRWEQDWD